MGVLPESCPFGSQYVDVRVRKSQSQELNPRTCLLVRALCSERRLAKHIRLQCCLSWGVGSSDWGEYTRRLSNRSECDC